MRAGSILTIGALVVVLSVEGCAPSQPAGSPAADELAAASDGPAIQPATETDKEMYDRAYRLAWASRDWEATEIMMILAERGHPPAEYWIGSEYLSGRVLEHSDAEAVRWIRRAAEHGHALAQLNLGIMYRDGRRGLTRDLEQARRWLALAAAQGDSSAKAALIQLEGPGSS